MPLCSLSGRAARRILPAAFGLLATLSAHAQAPAWDGAYSGATATATILSSTRAVATDARGNVFVTGLFNGTLSFGSTTLTSAGGLDIFVAKWVPATRTWAWAQRAGGTSDDEGQGIAVSGSSIYVTGSLQSTSTNGSGVSFGGTTPANSPAQVNGASPTQSRDLFVAKYTDNGPSATFGWSQVGGGTGSEGGLGVAVSGSSVYVTGYLENNTANANAVVFGGGGTTAGTTRVNGATSTVSVDVLLAKYTDNGPSATLGWTQVGGGTSFEQGVGVAASGSSVYVTGTLVNNIANSNGVLFGGSGTTAGTVRVNGAVATTNPARDILLVKYVDNGPTATLGWTQVGGGTANDAGQAVAVSGSSVYVTGYIFNSRTNINAVVFGGNGSTAGTSPQYGASSSFGNDLVLAKYTDNGSSATFGWSQVGGGNDNESGRGVAVSGSRVYVTGWVSNDAGNTSQVGFGGSGTGAPTAVVNGRSSIVSLDVVVARYTDNGLTATYNWAQVGGSAGTELGYAIALSGQQVYVGGEADRYATFGPTTLPVNNAIYFDLLARLTDADLVPLATRADQVAGRPALFPNPASGGAATLTGAQPGATVTVLDAQGRSVATATADATGTAALTLLAGH
jgi:hypothetical protein